MPDIYTPNPQKAMEELLEFRSQTPGTYGKGMLSSAITFVNRQKAEENAVTFIDPMSILEPGQPADILEKEIAAQETLANHNTILTGAIGFDPANKKSTDKFKDFINLLNKLNPKPKNIIIPVSCPTGKKDEFHALTIVLEENGGKFDTKIIDNQEENNISNVKDALKTTLNPPLSNSVTPENGIYVSSENDCATFSSFVANQIISGNPYNSCDKDILKDTHEKDINSAQEAYFNYYINHPTFQTYLTSIGIELDDFKTWSSTQKDSFISKFSLPETNEFTVDDEANIPADEKWKKSVRPIFRDICVKYNRPYVEFKDKDDPKPLKYKEGKNNIEFTSLSHANTDSTNMTDYIMICETARALGHSTITFGKFAEHPELKAKLYLACLQTGMGMKNAPADIDELKDFPEYKEIKKHDFEKRIKETNQMVISTKDTWENSPERSKLISALQLEKDKCNNFLKSNPNGTDGKPLPKEKSIFLQQKEYISWAKKLATETDHKKREDLLKKMKSNKETIKTLKQEEPYKASFKEYELAKGNIEKDKDYKAYKDAQTQQESLMTEAINFYLETNNSTSDKDMERVEKLLKFQASMMDKFEDTKDPTHNETDDNFTKRKEYKYSEMITQRTGETDKEFEERKGRLNFDTVKNDLKKNDKPFEELKKGIIKQMIKKGGRSPF